MEFSLINLFLIILAAWLAGLTVSKLGYPSVLGELAAGIIFGPPILGWVHGDAGIELLGRLGVMLMMLYVGMRVNLQDLLRSAGTALLVTVGGFLLPFALGYFVVVGMGGDTNTGLIVGTVIGVTALATLPRITVDLNIVETQLGQTLIGSALFSVAVSLGVFTMVRGIIDAGQVDFAAIGEVVVRLVVFGLAAIALGRWVVPLAARGLKRVGVESLTSIATFILLIGVAYGAMAEAAGLHVILGGFLAGLFLDVSMFDEREFSALTEFSKNISLGFLTPIFFVSAGFAFSFGAFQSNLALLLLVLFVAMAGKIVGGIVCSLLAKRTWQEGLVLGFGINGRGGVDIVIAGASLLAGYISQDVFSILIFTTFVTTLSVPILLKIGVGWLRGQGLLVKS